MKKILEKAKRMGKNALVGALMLGSLGVSGCGMGSLDRKVKPGKYTLADGSIIEVKNGIHVERRVSKDFFRGEERYELKFPKRYMIVSDSSRELFFIDIGGTCADDFRKVTITSDGNQKSYTKGPIFNEARKQRNMYFDKIDSINAYRADSIEQRNLEVLTR